METEKISGEKIHGVKKLVFASDHAGFEMKLHLIAYAKKYSVPVEDAGCLTSDPCDYPDFGNKLALEVLKDPLSTAGVLVCGSGVGISMAGNKTKGIRCGLCHDKSSAKAARVEAFCNVLALGGRVVGVKYAEDILDALFEYPLVESESYKTITELVSGYEKKNLGGI